MPRPSFSLAKLSHLGGDDRSVAERLVRLPRAERRAVLAGLDEADVVSLLYTWRFWARPSQLAPAGRWTKWGIVAGRGYGKTRAGVEKVRDWAESGTVARIHVIGRTAGDVRDTIIEGESGLLAVSHPDFFPRYEPSKARLTWPNGCVALLFSAEEPEKLRGPQCEKAYADEVAAWKYAREAWDQLMFGLRLGDLPQVVFTTTPKPIKLIKELLSDPAVRITRGSTYENRANLSADWFSEIVNKYEGTRLGRQELLGELLTDVPGALWTLKLIDDFRVASRRPNLDRLSRIAVAVDPAVTSNESSNETGIIVGGRDNRWPKPHFYIWNDSSGRFAPYVWGSKVVELYRSEEADAVVGEVNNGGDLVESNVHAIARDVNFREVRATRGKQRRAEPVAALYEQGRVHHCGEFEALEDQMTTYVPDQDLETGPAAKNFDSPDRMDALVWLITELSAAHEPARLPPSASVGTFG